MINRKYFVQKKKGNFMASSNGNGWFKTLVIAAAVLVGVGYFVSAPFRSKVDRQIEQATKWTPENIQKDPEGYLYFAQGEVSDAKDSLEANLIDIAQRKERTRSLFLDRSSERDAIDAVLIDLRAAYIESRKSDVWPAMVGERFIAEPELKKQILEAHDRLETAKSSSGQLQSLLTILDKRDSEIRDQVQVMESTSRKIDSDMEMLKTTRTLEEFSEIKIDLSAINSVSTILSQIPSEDSLEALIAEKRAVPTDDNFESILLGDD